MLEEEEEGNLGCDAPPKGVGFSPLIDTKQRRSPFRPPKAEGAGKGLEAADATGAGDTEAVVPTPAGSEGQGDSWKADNAEEEEEEETFSASNDFISPSFSRSVCSIKTERKRLDADAGAEEGGFSSG
mmetsp:Transcript_49624/g.97797  ORF Transcript_49624/g.97797 Transcript_49624/m.97797 type:complete len:128 (+) Transcript_49624:681-1064(+)